MPLSGGYPSTISYVEDYGTNYAIAAGASGFIDQDISADIPAGTLWVQLRVYSASGASSAGARKNGSSETPYTHISSSGYSDVIVEPDSSRVIEVQRDAAQINGYRILGYFIRS